MTREWSELRDEFRAYAWPKRVSEVASDLPADRRTIYRLLKGETNSPTMALRSAIERMLSREADRAEHHEPR